jgi:hypothetical protein
MTVTPELKNVLAISSGICWTLVYLLLIRRGFLEKTYGMPLAALCANISWEFIFAFILRVGPPQNYINVIWFVFDAVIVFQFLRYGPSIVDETFPKQYFYPGFLVALLVAFFGVLTVSYEFEDFIGKYAAFAQNLMMSILFVVMLLRRKSVKGQSMYIAILKMVGTILPSILFFLSNPSAPFMDYLYISILGFDLLYTVLLYQKLKEANLNPWRRF